MPNGYALDAFPVALPSKVVAVQNGWTHLEFCYLLNGTFHHVHRIPINNTSKTNPGFVWEVTRLLTEENKPDSIKE